MVFWDILAGTAIGALSGMGVGSAGLLVIYLTLFRGFDQRTAQGLNLCFFIFASASAALIHRNRRKIDSATVALNSLGGMPGAYLGCLAASFAHPQFLRKAFGVFLTLAGVLSLLKSRKNPSLRR